jgi:hypothetical protein
MNSTFESTSTAESSNLESTSLLQSIIESFAGDLTPLFNAIDKLIIDVRSDEEIKSLAQDFDIFVNRSLNDSGYITTSKAGRTADLLINRIQEMIASNSDWKADLHLFIEEIKKCFDTAHKDRALVKLGDAMAGLEVAMTRCIINGIHLIEGGGIWHDISQVCPSLYRFLPFLNQSTDNLNTIGTHSKSDRSIEGDFITQNRIYRELNSFVLRCGKLIDFRSMASMIVLLDRYCPRRS